MEGKTVQFEANKKQKIAFAYLTDQKTRSIGYGGGAGGGKSFLGCFWLYMMSDSYPKTRWFMGRNELKRLKQTTLATFFKVVDEYQLPREYKYNAQDGVIVFPNESEILLLDLAYQPSDPMYQRFGSLELTGGFVDESAEVRKEAIDILSTRCGRQNNEKYGIVPKLLETFNPDKGHVYSRFYVPHRDGLLDDRTKFVPALVTDEPRIPREYIEQLEHASETTRQRLLYGNFDYDDDPAILFGRDELEAMFNRNEAEEGEMYMTCDVARKGDDRTVYTVWKGTQCKKIITRDKTLINEVIAEIQDLEREWKVPRCNIVIDEDGVGGGVVDNVRGCQGFINNSVPIAIREQHANYENLKTQCYYRMAALVERGRVIIQDDKYKGEIIQELEQVRQRDADVVGKLKITRKADIKANIGKSPDIADALAMRFYPFQPRSRTRAPINISSLIKTRDAYN